MFKNFLAVLVPSLLINGTAASAATLLLKHTNEMYTLLTGAVCATALIAYLLFISWSAAKGQ